jgi:hypothetical protein
MIVLDAAILHVWQNLDLMTELRAFFAAYRPGIADRTLEVLTPETHLTALVQLATTSAERMDEVMSNLASGRFGAVVSVKESPQTRRQENRRAGGIALGLLGTSALLLTRVFTHTVLRSGIVVVAIACFLLPLLRKKS